MEPDDTVAALIADYGDRLLRLAFQLTHDQASAEDVVQEALMRIYRTWQRRMPAVEYVEAYARRAVVNEYLRRKRLRSASEVVTAAPPDVAVAADDSVLDRDAMWQALGALPPRQRAVLVLRFYEDMPDAAIADFIGAREGTVRSLASRGLAALREQPESVIRGTS